MIKTIAIIGAGKAGMYLALAFAKASPEGYVVEIFDESKQALAKVRSQPPISGGKAGSLWFSKSAHNAAWGADVVVLDMPSMRLLPALRALIDAPNDNAIITIASTANPHIIARLKSLAKESGRRFALPCEPVLLRVWQVAGIAPPSL